MHSHGSEVQGGWAFQTKYVNLLVMLPPPLQRNKTISHRGDYVLIQQRKGCTIEPTNQHSYVFLSDFLRKQLVLSGSTSLYKAQWVAHWSAREQVEQVEGDPGSSGHFVQEVQCLRQGLKMLKITRPEGSSYLKCFTRQKRFIPYTNHCFQKCGLRSANCKHAGTTVHHIQPAKRPTLL